MTISSEIDHGAMDAFPDCLRIQDAIEFACGARTRRSIQPRERRFGAKHTRWRDAGCTAGAIGDRAIQRGLLGSCLSRAQPPRYIHRNGDRVLAAALPDLIDQRQV